jgi:hypothetical protein
MSKRPTSNKCCTGSTGTTGGYGYAIIGDTVAATLYAKRLISNRITAPINLINEGVNRINFDDITDTDFIAQNNKTSLHFLKSEKIHMVTYGHNEYNGENATCQQSQIIQFHVPQGPLGDFISAYHLPRLGPWFTHATDSRAEKFFTCNTTKSPLNAQETTVTNYLSNLWHLPQTSSFIVKKPSILNCHHTFMTDFNVDAERELFLESYQMVSQENNVDYITEATNIEFQKVSGPVYNITGNGLTVNNVKPVWKTNLYTYLRLATDGDLNPSSVQIPVFYRSVIPIPQNAGSVDLTSLTDVGDLITTHIALSLHDIHGTKNSSLAWLIQCYTTAEDLSVVEPTGKYADSGKTLLIVEAISTKNRRQATYDVAEKEIQSKYNARLVESSYLKQFATIVSNIYTAYTGSTISVDSLVSDSSVCDPSGTCRDTNYVVDFSQRQSPLVTIIETVGQLYGSDLYPIISKC